MARNDHESSPTASNPSFLLHKEGCTIEDYRLIVRIGEGTFGEVWKAERAGTPVALKILKTSMSSDETQRELKSLETLRALAHNYLLHTENFWSDGDRLFIEMELADGGTLKERLRAYQAAGKRAIPEDELLKLFSEAAQALDYLHGHRPVFLHRDIKPANILIVRGCAKLGDFGLLRQVAGDNSSTKTQGGTFPYMAPESIASDVFSPYTDLFALAVSYAELRQGELPFPGKNQYQICERILRAPPELAELFHPEERRVLLKALEKDPRQRFGSCGEFIFELNRVVPWIAALAIPEMAPPRPAESAGKSPTTKNNQPTGPDPGTSRKRPLATMADIELPPAPPSAPPAALPTAPAPRRDPYSSAIIRDERTSTDPPLAPVTAPVPELAPAAGTHVPRLTGTSRPAPRRAPPRAIGAIGIAAAVVLLVSGVWYLLSQSAGSDVRELIVAKKYPEALSAIETSSRLLLPNATHLHKQVEDEWFAELREPAPAAPPAAIRKWLHELDQFDQAFPGRDSSQARRKGQAKRLQETLDPQIDPFLAARQFEKARDVLTPFRDLLPDGGKALTARIQARQDAVAAVTVTPKPVEPVTPDPGRAGLVEAMLAAAWKPLLENTVKLDACRNALKDAQEKLGTGPVEPPVEKNLLAIDALIRARASDKAAGHKAVAELAAILRAPPSADAGALGRNAWVSLDRLDADKALLDFDDLDALPALPDDAAARKAGTALFARVLDRRLRRDGFAWLPTKEQMAKIVTWCDQRNGTPHDTVAALYAECLLESGAPAARVNAIELPRDGDWYVVYVQALVKDRAQEPAAAADMFAGVVTKDARAVQPAQRVDAVARVLRRAVATLPRSKETGRPFAKAPDAARAKTWLQALLALAPQPTPDDLGTLAIAAIQLDDAATLDAIVKTIPARLPQAERAKAYVLVGSAYRLSLQYAAAELAQGGYEPVVVRTTRAERYAELLRQADLEEAAELNAQAVQFAARAAFAAAKPDDKRAAKYRVYAEALSKSGAGDPPAWLVPTVVAKLEFARTADCPVKHLEATLTEGQAALKIAAEQETARPARHEWWAKMRCKGMVKLADVSIRSLQERLKVGETISEDERTAQYTSIRSLYDGARRMKKYTERWPGELAFDIGNLDLALRDVDSAARELADCLKSIQSTPGPYSAEVEGVRTYLKKTLPQLQKAMP